MFGKKPLVSFLLLIIFTVFAPAICRAGVETANAYAYKISIERHLEDRLNRVLREVLKIDDLLVIVNAKVINAKLISPSMQPLSATSGKRPLLLPGVPLREKLSITKGEAPTGPSPQVLQNLILTILVDESLSEASIDSIHDVALSVLDFNPDRGDRIEIRKVDFQQSGLKWKRLLYPQNLLKLVIGILAAIFLAAAATFFLHPFRSFANSLDGINWTNIKDIIGPRDNGSSQDFQRPMAQGAISSTQPFQQVQAVAGSNPAEHAGNSSSRFGFISASNITGAGFLLQDAPVEDVALVLGYMSPELATKLLGMFPVARQAEAVALLTNTRKLEPEMVDRLEQSIKEQLDYVVGGEDQLAAILDMADDETRDRTISDIERKDFNAGIRIREKSKSLESIIRALSSKDLLKIIRLMDPAIFARILNSAPGDVQTKALECLSQGGAERMREEMKYAGTFPAEKLKVEKRNVVAVYRELLEAGEIQENKDNGMEI